MNATRKQLAEEIRKSATCVKYGCKTHRERIESDYDDGSDGHHATKTIGTRVSVCGELECEALIRPSTTAYEIEDHLMAALDDALDGVALDEIGDHITVEEWERVEARLIGKPAISWRVDGIALHLDIEVRAEGIA